MNPNDNTQNANNGLNQASQSPNATPFVTPQPIGFDMPQTPQNVDTVVSAQPQASTAPQPMPAGGVNVTPTPMPTAPSNVTPTPVSSPQVDAAPLPSSQPAPVAEPTQVVNNQQIAKEDPNAKIAQISVPPSVPQGNLEQVTVDNKKKKKGSNFFLFLIIGILIYFAINIDKMAEMYDNYIRTGSLTATDVVPDNTTQGYVKIGEPSSSMKVYNINFYNFSKSNAKIGVSFNYSSFETYEDPTSLKIYIELYNSNKELIYKELFNVSDKIVKNTTTNYMMELESDLAESAFYVLVKTYTEDEENVKLTLTCKKTDDSFSYENKYYFTNNELKNYDVSKKSLTENNTSLQKEYDKIKGELSSSFDNNELKYSVDLNKNYTEYVPSYKIGTTPVTVKNREILKEWICE